MLVTNSKIRVNMSRIALVKTTIMSGMELRLILFLWLTT